MDLHQNISPNQASINEVRDLLGTVDLAVLDSNTSWDTWTIKLKELVKQRKKFDQLYLAIIRNKIVHDAIEQRAASLECMTSKVLKTLQAAWENLYLLTNLLKQTLMDTDLYF